LPIHTCPGRSDCGPQLPLLSTGPGRWVGRRWTMPVEHAVARRRGGAA
jgi:hypothetical protein